MGGDVQRAQCAIDLAAELGIKHSAVIKVCKRLGIRGVDKGHDIPAGDVTRVRRALGAAARASARTSAVAGRPTLDLKRPPMRAEPAPRPPRVSLDDGAASTLPKPVPKPLPKPLDAYYQGKHQEALAEVRVLQAEVARLQAELERAQRPSPAPRKNDTPSNAAPSLQAVLDGAGFGQAKVEALKRLLNRPAVADRVLKTLSVADKRTFLTQLDRLLIRSCGDAGCEEVVAYRERESLRVSGPDCAVCNDSTQRRAFARMVMVCERAAVRQVLVVGGSPKARAQLQRLAQSPVLGPSLKLTLVDGTKKASQQRANGDVSGQDLVVVWCNTQIAHATSDVYRAAARTLEAPILNVLGRGIESLADAVREQVAPTSDSGNA